MGEWQKSGEIIAYLEVDMEIMRSLYFNMYIYILQRFSCLGSVFLACLASLLQT